MSQGTREGMPNIFPALSYRDAPAALDWLTDAFGFEKGLVVPGPEGTIVHAEMSLGPGVIMLASAEDAMGWMSPRDLPGVNQTISVYVEDVNAHYERAKAAGAEIVLDIADTNYGSRGYSARDLEGHFWNFGTYHPWTYQP
ncbi:MAG: VOC family protein [Dehalococcoidia bacterium]